MPRKREAEPLIKRTLNFYGSSYLRMQELYPTMGAAKAIRQLVHQHVIQVEAKLARGREDVIDEIEIDLEDLEDGDE